MTAAPPLATLRYDLPADIKFALADYDGDGKADVSFKDGAGVWPGSIPAGRFA